MTTSNDREPLANMGIVHPHCAPKPQEKYQEKPADFYVGKFVKLGFDTVPEEADEQTQEHMWVKVTGLAETDGEELRGELNNDPVLNVGYRCGDLLEFSRSEIEDVLAVPSEN
jgi:uncharacterized protein YegJ (DUF2314 family)